MRSVIALARSRASFFTFCNSLRNSCVSLTFVMMVSARPVDLRLLQQVALASEGALLVAHFRQLRRQKVRRTSYHLAAGSGAFVGHAGAIIRALAV
jgi:hypothetical protein